MMWAPENRRLQDPRVNERTSENPSFRFATNFRFGSGTAVAAEVTLPPFESIGDTRTDPLSLFLSLLFLVVTA